MALIFEKRENGSRIREEFARLFGIRLFKNKRRKWGSNLRETDT
jgi:hypothetical protein